MIPLELTMVAMALPRLERDLGFGLVGGAWVIDAYMVAFASLVLAAGALADRFGRARVLLLGILVFAATSALCGAAGSASVLLAARTAQGVGAALTISAGLGVLADRFRDEAARFRAFGAFTTAIGVGMASGPTLGGAVVATFGWRATFYVHVPVALLAAGLAIVARMPETSEATVKRFDVVGTALATTTLALVVGTLIESGSLSNAWAIGLLASGVVFCALFVAVERRVSHPVFDFTLLRHPAFASAQATALAYSSAFGALLVFLPRVFEMPGQHSSDGAWGAGFAMLPLTAPALVIPIIAARFARRLPPRTWLAGGLLIAAVGALGTAMALLGEEVGQAPLPFLPAMLVLTGGGFAAANAHLTNIAMAPIPLAQAGVASGMNFTVRQAGVALGVAAAGRLYAVAQATTSSEAVVPLVADVCIAASVVSIMGAVAAWLLGPRRWAMAGGR